MKITYDENGESVNKFKENGGRWTNVHYNKMTKKHSNLWYFFRAIIFSDLHHESPFVTGVPYKFHQLSWRADFVKKDWMLMTIVVLTWIVSPIVLLYILIDLF